MPKTTGGLHRKSKSRIIGKKRRLESPQNDNADGSDSNSSEPARKKRKCDESKEEEYCHPDGTTLSKKERKEMKALKCEEHLLMREIAEIQRPKEKVDYDHLEELIEKWTVAAQDMVHAIIKDKNDPDITVRKVLGHFKIDPKQVRWNEEDEEFE